MGRILHYLKLTVVVMGAGVLSGVLVMTIALRDKGDIKVPSIEGDEIVTALEKITRAGLNLKITQLSYDAAFPRNAVISQDPQPESLLKRGRDVRVVISKGAEDIEMPDIRDMTLRHAKNVIHARGVPSPLIIKIHSPVPDGTVIAQLPPAGDRVAEISHVQFLVSKGEAEKLLIQSDYHGMTLEKAADKILAAGLKLGRVRYIERDDSNAEGVFNQEPPPGKPITEGSEVSLVVLRNSDIPDTPKTFTVYNFVVPPDKEKGLVSVISENIEGEKLIYKRKHASGDTVSILVKVAGQTTVSVYMDNELIEVKRF